MWTAISDPFCALNSDAVASISENIRFNVLSLVFILRQKVKSSPKVLSLHLPF